MSIDFFRVLWTKGYLLLFLGIFGLAIGKNTGLFFILVFVVVYGTLHLFKHNSADRSNDASCPLPIIVLSLSPIIFGISEFISTSSVEMSLNVIAYYKIMFLLWPLCYVLRAYDINLMNVAPFVAISAMIYMGLGIYQSWWLGYHRIESATNPIVIGMVVVQFQFILAVTTLSRSKFMALLLLGMVACFAVVILSGSRMPILVSSLILVFWCFSSKIPSNLKVLVFLACASFLYIHYLMNPYSVQYWLGKFTALWHDVAGQVQTAAPPAANVENVENGAQVTAQVESHAVSRAFPRKWIWLSGLQSIQDYPFWGGGWSIEPTKEFLLKHGMPEQQFPPKMSPPTFRHFHNDFINISARFGLVVTALLAVMHLLFLKFIDGKKNKIIWMLYLVELGALSLTDTVSVHYITLTMWVLFSALLAAHLLTKNPVRYNL